MYDVVGDRQIESFATRLERNQECNLQTCEFLFPGDGKSCTNYYLLTMGEIMVFSVSTIMLCFAN
jgi:hypothetical protein